MKHLTYWIFIVALGIFLSELAYAADTTIRYKDQPPPSAISPSISIGSGADICVVVRSGAVGTPLFSSSIGVHVVDKNCERIKLSRALAQLGLKVSATAMLCQDIRIFKSMISAGSPCPINGLIGKDAIAEYRKRGILDEQNNVLRDPNVLHINISNPRRNNDFGQPTQ